ncbi:MAG: nucleotide exchange factor GrpE [Actinomycetota bacterium]
MTDDGRRRIPIVDRRVAHQPPPAAGSGAAPSAPDASPGSSPAVEASPTGGQPPRPSGSGAMPPYDDASHPAPLEQPDGEQQDFLADLQRLQADFDNYRKRMLREQAATSTRAKARLMEQLLPVLDDFERALEHEGSSGMELLYKQLRSTLEAEGLEEIEAEGKPFDPNFHEAIDSREDPDVKEIVVRSVYRRGYKVGDQVLRAAMVVVARPPESTPARNEDERVEKEAGAEPAAQE